MFKKWTTVVQDLNSNWNNENMEKAKELGKKYVTKGFILKILGILSIILSIASFITFSIVDIGDYTMIIVIVASLFFPVSAAIIGFGAAFSRLGKRLIYLGNPANNPFANLNVSQNIINAEVNESIDNQCPYCGEKVSKESLFCSKCGRKLKVTCSKCGQVNDSKNNYCEKCGADLRF